ncbi:MAG: hypothetical protein ABIW48_00540 [Burkholderiales bacterium]
MKSDTAEFSLRGLYLRDSAHRPRQRNLALNVMSSKRRKTDFYAIEDELWPPPLEVPIIIEGQPIDVGPVSELPTFPNTVMIPARYCGAPMFPCMPPNSIRPALQSTIRTLRYIATNI